MCCTIYCVYVTPLACCFLFFFNRSSSFGTFSLSLHDALPIYFFFVPDMVARGEDIDAPIEEFICDFGSHSKTRRGVLAIQDREIDLILLLQLLQILMNDGSTGFSNRVADKKNFHRR